MITRDDMEAMGYAYYEYDKTDLKGPTRMTQEFARLMQQLPNPTLYATLIQEEFDEWRSEFVRDTTTPQLKELADLVYVIYGYANAMGWKLDEAVYRVHKNNVGRCIQPDGSIQRREDGKIIKNPNYPKPDLEDLV
jgi:predicted HAD superfamily Cof-like phosphohydrolase